MTGLSGCGSSQPGAKCPDLLATAASLRQSVSALIVASLPPAASVEKSKYGMFQRSSRSTAFLQTREALTPWLLAATANCWHLGEWTTPFGFWIWQQSNLAVLLVMLGRSLLSLSVP